MTICTAIIRGDAVHRGGIGEPRHGPEEAVARLWQNADQLASGLVTQDGRRLRVLYPGRRSSAAGPDFRDCVLSADDGEIVVGDVEVHVRASGWSAHGHHVDPNYNGVVLHVVLAPGARTTTTLESGAETPVAALGFPSQEAEFDSQPAYESSRIESLPSLQQRLDRAGDARFRSKADGYSMEIEAGDGEQALYAGIMEALGYSSNRKPFSALAASVSMARLRAALGRHSGDARLLGIRALLVSAARLMSSAGPEEAERFQDALRGLPSVEEIKETWNVFRVRPANHPLRRLEGAAVLTNRAFDEGFISALAGAARQGAPRPVIRRLIAPPYVGEARAREIAVNVALPFLYAWGGIARDRDLREAAMEAYRRMPNLGDNEITREMKRLLPPDIDTRGARRQQGLLHLYKHMRSAAGAFGISDRAVDGPRQASRGERFTAAWAKCRWL